MQRGFCVVNHFLGFVYLLVFVYLFDLGGGCRGVFILWKFIELPLRSVSFSICTDTQFQVASCISHLWSCKNQSFKISVAFNTNSFLFVVCTVLRLSPWSVSLGVTPVMMLPYMAKGFCWSRWAPCPLVQPPCVRLSACPVLARALPAQLLPTLPRVPRSATGTPLWSQQCTGSSPAIFLGTSSLSISWLQDKIIKADLT